MLIDYVVQCYNGLVDNFGRRIFTLVNRRVKGEGENDEKEVRMILSDGMMIASMNDQV